jgi:DUF2934 family protein
VSAVPSELERDAARHGRRLRGILRGTLGIGCVNAFTIVGSQALAPRAERPATPEAIARRAFEIYCERGRRDGDDLADWLRAERECGQKTASDAPFRLRIQPDRRQHCQPPPGFDRRRARAK